MASRAREARKAEKTSAPPPDGAKLKVDAKPREDDLSPNVCALVDVTRLFLI
jgi:lysyl-tRNA synthetase class 2